MIRATSLAAASLVALSTAAFAAPQPGALAARWRA